LLSAPSKLKDVRVRDQDVRAAVWAELDSRHGRDPNTLMLDELALWHGSTRIDIAVVNGEITGYELKSDSDTLDRLRMQAEIYSAVLDRVILVSGEKHSQTAHALVPSWWGITEASQERKKRIQLRSLRAPGRNPGVCPTKLCSLLWRDEALAALEQRGAARGVRRRDRETIYERLANTVPLEELRDLVRETLKRREGWRTNRRAALVVSGALPGWWRCWSCCELFEVGPDTRSECKRLHVPGGALSAELLQP
jgi:hypothetical protein